MSQDNVLPMDPQQASEHLLQKVYVPTFMAKLAADYGIHPNSEEDVQNLLRIAASLAQGMQQRQLNPPPTSLFIDDAMNELSGHSKVASAQEYLNASEIQLMAQQLQNDPNLLQAALVYGYSTAR